MHFSIEHEDHEGLSLCLVFLFVYCRITLIILDFNWWLSTSHLNEARGKCSIIEITFPPQKNNQQTSVSLEKSLEANQPAKNNKKQVNKNIRKNLTIAMEKKSTIWVDIYLVKKKHGGFSAIAMLARKSSPSARAFGSCKTMPPRRPKNIWCRCGLWWWQNAQWGEKRRWLFSGNMTQLWDSICILYIFFWYNVWYVSQNHMKIVQVEYALILLTLDVQVEKKPLNCKTYWLPTLLPTTGPMVPTDCAVPRCQEMTAQAFLKVDNESQKQFENRCNFCCTGTLGMIFGSEGELREGFVALVFFSKEIATVQTLMVLKIFFGS